MVFGKSKLSLSLTGPVNKEKEKPIDPQYQ